MLISATIGLRRILDSGSYGDTNLHYVVLLLLLLLLLLCTMCVRFHTISQSVCTMFVFVCITENFRFEFLTNLTHWDLTPKQKYIQI